jgi:hypothetical protein
MDASAADKKRNKLGYHRTSVACGEHQVIHWQLSLIIVSLGALVTCPEALSRASNVQTGGGRQRVLYSMLAAIHAISFQLN